MCMVASPFHIDKAQAVVYTHQPSLRHRATSMVAWKQGKEHSINQADVEGAPCQLCSSVPMYGIVAAGGAMGRKESTETNSSYLDILKQMFLAVCRYRILVETRTTKIQYSVLRINCTVTL